MRHLTMAGKSLLIGDEVGELLLQYASLIADIGGGDVVTVQAIGIDGSEVSVGFLLNSGTVMLIESTASELPEPDNTRAMEYMSRRLVKYRLDAAIAAYTDQDQD